MVIGFEDFDAGVFVSCFEEFAGHGASDFFGVLECDGHECGACAAEVGHEGAVFFRSLNGWVKAGDEARAVGFV